MRNNSYRSVKQVPLLILCMAVFFMLLQLELSIKQKENNKYSFQQLTKPQNVDFYRMISLGSNRLMSYLLAIGLQLHDNQKGKHVSYSRLDYDFLSQWLRTVYLLNPDSEYPAFLASRVYSQVKEKNKVRLMIQQIELMFESNPQKFWRRMTEACLLAKHQLKDLDLALNLAKQISSLPQSIKMPFWARDMKLILLDELDQNESAALLIVSLLQSGQIIDTDEKRFLEFRLSKIKQKMSEFGQ